MKDQLAELGLRVHDLIAGFAGGVVNAFVFRRTAPYAVISSIIAGALTANYLGAHAARMLGLSGGAAAFIVGLAAMAVCQRIVEAARNWRPGSKG